MNVINIICENVNCCPLDTERDTVEYSWAAPSRVNVDAISGVVRMASLLLSRRGMSYQSCSHSVAFLCLQMGGKRALSITSTQSGPSGHRGLRMETSDRWHFVGTVESSEDNHVNSITIRVILNGTLSKPMSKVTITIPLEGSGLWRVPVKPQQCVAFNRKCAGRRQEELNWDQSSTVRILFRVISGFSSKTY